MAFKLFGFKIGKDEPDTLQSFVPPTDEDASMSVVGGGAYGTYLDLEGGTGNEDSLIRRYREMAIQPECDTAVDDVVNECIVYNDFSYPVEVVLDRLEYPEAIKTKIQDEFAKIMKLLDFSNQGYDVFKRWYVDGRLNYHILIDENKPRNGIKELRYIDPRKIRKVKEMPKKVNTVGVNTQVFNKPIEYFLFADNGFARDGSNGLKISTDSICYVHSGITDKDGKTIISHLHKAIKPLNQLRMLEDATVIYRISRAPERRIFYIDVGNLPKLKAEQYLNDVMNKYKNKLVYDANTGEVRDDRKYQTMLEDFWLPRREGGKGTQIDTLPGGQSLGQIDDVVYFQKLFYKSLNVPVSRMESDAGFSMGRSSEITRDEIKFNKFVGRLRLRFSHLFDRLLETQLLLKGICTKAEWKVIKEGLSYDFISDSHFTEMKDVEILRERLSILQEIDPYVGKYFTHDFVYKRVLQLSEEDVQDLNKTKEEEEKQGLYDSDEDGEPPFTQGQNQGPPQPPVGPAGPVGPAATQSIKLSVVPEAQPAEEKPAPKKKKVVANESVELSEEQSDLVKSMTKLFDSLADEESDNEHKR
jgi:hypothetical protein